MDNKEKMPPIVIRPDRKNVMFHRQAIRGGAAAVVLDRLHAKEPIHESDRVSSSSSSGGAIGGLRLKTNTVGGIPQRARRGGFLDQSADLKGKSATVRPMFEPVSGGNIPEISAKGPIMLRQKKEKRNNIKLIL